MAVKKICVLSVGKAGIPLSVVIAFKCPEIRVTVVQTSPENTYHWNTGQISLIVPGLEDFIRKCQNKNLVFTTSEVLAIKEADIIFIVSESKLKCYGDGKDEAVDLSQIEEAAFLIVEHAESNKIIVETSSIPLKSAECLWNVFKHNQKPGMEFQVLSNPEFQEHVTSFKKLLSPDCVLIGSEDTPQGLAAAKKLSSVYERWVEREKIITRSTWSVELSKIATSAMAAQILASFFSMSSVCELRGGDISLVMKMVSRKGCVGFPDFGLSFKKLSVVLHTFVYMCEYIDLSEVADYWRQVLKIYSLHERLFLEKFVWILNEIKSKKIALLGFAYCKDTQVTEGSAAVDLCKTFLEEGASVNIYDTKVSKTQVLEDIMSAGCKLNTDRITSAVTMFEDVYKAVQKCQVIVTWSSSLDLSSLDFESIFTEMVKPAYVFDRGHNLPYETLSKIGFKVYAVGKCLQKLRLV